MSKKKRQLREKSAVSGEPTTSIALGYKPNKQIDDLSQSTAKASGFGLLRYLKAHGWVLALISFLSLGALGSGLKYLEEDARRQILSGDWKNGQNQSFLNRINPFLPAAPVMNSTHQLSKEYIYAGDRLLAVEDANATAVPPADLAVWRPSTGGWYVMGPGGSMRAAEGWGLADDIARPGDYDGDGKTDFCVFRPSTNTWLIRRSSNGGIDSPGFGIADDIPAPADFDGDGITDVAVLRKFVPSSDKGTWYIRKSSDQGYWALEIEIDSDTDIKTLAPADYDGDGKADVAVWRKSIKSFRWRKSSDGQLQTLSFAGTQFNLQQTSQEPVAGDYDGDGKDDFAVRDGGNWVILKSSNGGIQTTNWGLVTDKAVHNDYDADGKVDIGVFRDGAWYISNSSGGTRIENWGQAGDYPVPVFYRR